MPPAPYGATPPPYGYGPPAYYGPPGPVRRTNPLAIASMCCSLGTFITGVSCIAGIILGHIALKQIKQSGEDGESMAKVGLVLGYVFTVLGLLFAIGYIWLIVWTVSQDSY